MRSGSSVIGRALWALALVFTGAVSAAEEAQLTESINRYRGEVRSCAGQSFEALPALSADPRLALSPRGGDDLQHELSAAAYPMISVQAISLSGPRNAQAAMKVLQENYCRNLLDPQFVDIGVSQEGRDWRIVLARPLLTGKLGDWQAEGRKLLELVNEARRQSRQCGEQSFDATAPLSWNAALAEAAVSHSQAMANGNFFSHLGSDGRTPGDRAELAGYDGTRTAENIAAALDTPRKVLDGWLGSPGHCASVMSPRFSELGAGYAVNPQSDGGIYWTAMFGAP